MPARDDTGHIHDLTGPDLRNAILALAAATVAVSNDSGLLHVAAALGTPSIGIFGPTSPWHWAPLNPLAGVIEAATDVPCRPCHKPTCRLGHHRCMADIKADEVAAAVRAAFGSSRHSIRCEGRTWLRRPHQHCRRSSPRGLQRQPDSAKSPPRSRSAWLAGDFSREWAAKQGIR